MSDVRLEKSSVREERKTHLTVSVIGLVAALVSACVPWLLSRLDRAGGDAAASQSQASVDPLWPDLTLGVWQIRDAVDAEGTDFSGSTLRFMSQKPTPSGVQFEGFFEWRGNQLFLGREYFRADLDTQSRRMFIQGGYIEDAGQPPRLAVGSFSAQLSPDARELLDGRWGSTPGHMPGVEGGWTARR